MNAKPRWTAFLSVLAYCAVAVLALNSYQGRFGKLAQPQVSVVQPQFASTTETVTTQQPQLSDMSSAAADGKTPRQEAYPPELESIVPQSIAPATAADVPRSQSDNELLGFLAAELARTAMKEGSVVLPRQVVKRQPQRHQLTAKLVSFRLPRSSAKIEPPLPASLLVNYQSRLLATTGEVRALLNTYLRWVRFCTAIRGLMSDFEKAYLQPVLDRVQQRPAEVEVLFDLDDRTYELSRYA